MMHYLKLLRTEQYVKNLFIFAPAFFAGRLLDSGVFISALLVFTGWCLAASAIYILNDYCDINEDRQHPVKKMRPLASGAVDTKNALMLMVLLAAVALAIVFAFSPEAGYIILAYMLMNLLYSKWLKHVPVLDVNIIAAGFVLRILAGAAATNVEPSSWILLITFLLALFLAFGKRRADVLHFMEGREVRKNIDGYNLTFVDTVLSILAAVIIVCYIFYTISPEVQQHYHSRWLYVSIVFVINGLLYYMKLALVDKLSHSPTAILLRNRIIQGTLICWLLVMVYLLYIR